MSGRNTLRWSEHNAICDVCGFKFKSSQLKKRWDNLYVCRKDWEARQPLDFLRGKIDNQSTHFTRAEGVDSSGTDINGGTTNFIGNTTNVGDTDKTLTYGTDPDIQNWNSPLTANRTVALNASANGDIFQIYRTGGGAFTLDVGGIKTVPANVDALVTVKYINGWVLDSYTTLG